MLESVFVHTREQLFNTDKYKARAMGLPEGLEIQPESVGNGLWSVVERFRRYCDIQGAIAMNQDRVESPGAVIQ